MRSSLFFASGLSIAALLTCAVFACSSSEGGASSSSGTLPEGAPEGSVVFDDGAVVDPDGTVINPPVEAGPPPKTDATNETVDVLGAPRAYVLAVPKNYDAARKYPLIVALHGDGQNAASFRPFLGLEAFSGYDAIVAYPDRSEDIFTPYDQNQDQLLIEATINAVKGKYSIDDAKVWALGYSKGAYQIGEIACRKAGILKAMAIHAGGAPQERSGSGAVDCPNAVGVPTLVTHGSNDDPGGGQFGADYWAQLGGCGTTRTASTPAPCEKYDNCNVTSPVTFCLIPGLAHYPIWGGAAEASWNWFKTL